MDAKTLYDVLMKDEIQVATGTDKKTAIENRNPSQKRQIDILQWEKSSRYQ